jgi:bifunctional DNA-binding transcriptional regulator/antitoxin component of YhaV-PrlF toxin-antitoxin module
MSGKGLKDAIKKGIDKINFGEILGGGLLSTAASAVLGSKLATWITTAFSGSKIAAALSTAASNLGVGTAGAAGAALGAGVAGIIAGIPAYFVGIYDAIKNGIGWLNALVIPAGSTAAVAGIGAIIGACGGSIGAGVGALIGLAVGLVSDGVILITQEWETIVPALDNFFNTTIPSIWSKFVTKVNEFFTVTIPAEWNKFMTWMDGLPKEIEEWFDDLLQPVKDFDWRQFGYDMGNKAGLAVKTVCESVQTFITQTLPGVFDSVKSAFGTFFTQTLPNFVTQTIPNFMGTIKDEFLRFTDSFTEVGTSIWEGIKEGWNTSVQAVRDLVRGFVQGFKDALGIHSPSTVFMDIGYDVVDGLKNGIANKFKSMKSTISQWATSIVDWFKEHVSYKAFKELARDMIDGFIAGIASGFEDTKEVVESWGEGIVTWVENLLDINSPSRVFRDIAGFTIEGFNRGFAHDGKSTAGIVSNWANTISSVSPTMGFAVDTSALKYYDSNSFAKSVSANVTSNSSITATGFIEGMEEFYREYVEPTMVQMASDVRRQADKNEQTVVRIGNRTVNDAVTTQRRANGYAFAR